MQLRRCLAVAVPALLAAEPAAARPVDFDRLREPANLCSTLVPYGLDAGEDWQQSASRSNGWTCDRNGATRSCGEAAGGGPAGRVAYYVFGSGRRKVDRAVLQLTLHGEDSAACRSILREAAAGLSGAIGVRLPAKIDELLVRPRPPGEPLSGATGARAGQRLLLHEERQGWVRVQLTAEDARMTVLTVTFANPNASGVWK